MNQNPMILDFLGRTAVSSYEKDLSQFLDAWQRVQREMRTEERLEELAASIGRPIDELRGDLDHVARTLRRLGSTLTRRELVEHALKTHERPKQESGAD